MCPGLFCSDAIKNYVARPFTCTSKLYTISEFRFIRAGTLHNFWQYMPFSKETIATSNGEPATKTETCPKNLADTQILKICLKQSLILNIKVYVFCLAPSQDPLIVIGLFCLTASHGMSPSCRDTMAPRCLRLPTKTQDLEQEDPDEKFHGNHPDLVDLAKMNARQQNEPTP